MDDIFSLLEQRLSYLEQRQQVLAQNVANANTPGYKPRDMTRFAATLDSIRADFELAMTAPNHLSVAPDRSVAETVTSPAATGPDGNGVQLDDQLRRIAETDAAQLVATNLYAKYAGMMRLALGRTG